MGYKHRSPFIWGHYSCSWFQLFQKYQNTSKTFKHKRFTTLIKFCNPNFFSEELNIHDNLQKSKRREVLAYKIKLILKSEKGSHWPVYRNTFKHVCQYKFLGKYTADWLPLGKYKYITQCHLAHGQMVVFLKKIFQLPSSVSLLTRLCFSGCGLLILHHYNISSVDQYSCVHFFLVSLVDKC